jgi:transcriptional regulator with XRE-family HTH domain
MFENIVGNNSTAKERGKRLKLLRGMAGLKRDDLAREAGVSGASISYWENASLSELTEKNAEKVIKIIQKHGILCNIEWLLFGIGSSPRIKEAPENKVPVSLSSTHETKTLEQEIKLFLMNPGAAVLQVTSTAMSPVLEPEMTVGAIWVNPSEILINHQKLCIIELDGEFQARKINNILPNGDYDLSYLSYSSDLKSPFELKSIRLAKIAPIVRVWVSASRHLPSFLENLQKIS